MPSPKSGTAGTLVAPKAPEVPEEADAAEPGKVEEVKAEQRQTQTGKYGSVPATPHQEPQTQEEKEKKKSWIEIELLDEEENPVPGEPYQVKLPDGTVSEGTLGDDGKARIEGFEPGQCEVTFPNLDESVWNPK